MYSDERGLGATLTLDEQAEQDRAEMEQRMLATLRSGIFATPTQLPEIQVRASPLPFFILLGIVLFFAFGDRKGRDLW